MSDVEHRFKRVVDQIAQLRWCNLSRSDLNAIAWSYYYFSVQFRESLETACRLFSTDERLAQLRREECGTANLSPFPGVALPHEAMNHDEFMRRAIALSDTSSSQRVSLQQRGERYLAFTRSLPDMDRALAIASYEDGGLEAVFRAILTAPEWGGPALGAFRHFLTEHIRFDSDEEGGHGALSRHLIPDERVVPLWTAFLDLLVDAAPCLEHQFARANAAE